MSFQLYLVVHNDDNINSVLAFYFRNSVYYESFDEANIRFYYIGKLQVVLTNKILLT